MMGETGCVHRLGGQDGSVTDTELVRIRFQLQQDDDGWPPVRSEGLWGEHLGDRQYRLDNVPWFVRGVAEGDTVLAEPDSEGTMWATERLQWSGNCTIRVIPLADGPLAGSQQAVLDELTPLGASGEGFGERLNIVAFTVPPTADVAAIKKRLETGTADGSWEYEEGCIGDAWASA
jgi:hypothetical protein